MTFSNSQRFHDLYVAHYAAVFGYCVRRMGLDEARDTVAETFTVAWRRIADVPDGDRALPWLYGVAARTVANHRRSERRRLRLNSKLRGMAHRREAQPDIQVVRCNEDQQIIDAINRLRVADREVLLLSAWEGLSATQLADRFGIAIKAAEQRLTRAKRRLATELERTGERASLGSPRGERREHP